MRLFTSLVSFGLLATVVGQSNCDLIQSVTLTVPNASSLIGRIPNQTNLSSYVVLETQQWQYIAITKGPGNISKVYKNGQLIIQDTYLNLPYSWNRFELGAVFFTSYGAFFDGFIDEIRLSNVVRSDSDILNTYNSNSEFIQDANTIGLWHLNQNSGSSISATIGNDGLLNTAQWSGQGRFGQCLSFNGVNAVSRINQSIPTNNMTFEFWIKPNLIQDSWCISFYGINTDGFGINEITTNYLWSTGDTTTSVTVDPSSLPYIWVTDGSCTDTVWFNGSQIDTVLVTVTDTLLINTVITGVAPPNNVNTIRVFPNPAMDQVTVDFGNYGLLSGYSFRITNSIGQVVYLSPITQQSVMLPLGGWGGPGLYFVELRNPQGIAVDTRHIILQ